MNFQPKKVGILVCDENKIIRNIEFNKGYWTKQSTKDGKSTAVSIQLENFKKLGFKDVIIALPEGQVLDSKKEQFQTIIEQARETGVQVIFSSTSIDDQNPLERPLYVMDDVKASYPPDKTIRQVDSIINVEAQTQTLVLSTSKLFELNDETSQLSVLQDADWISGCKITAPRSEGNPDLVVGRVGKYRGMDNGCKESPLKISVKGIALDLASDIRDVPRTIAEFQYYNEELSKEVCLDPSTRL